MPSSGHLIDAVEGFDKLGGWAILPRREWRRDRLAAPGGGVEAEAAAAPLRGEFSYLRARLGDRVGRRR
ncbi:MAG: hypothetical protein U0232_11135 [Thermomicrobiales bacterium]